MFNTANKLQQNYNQSLHVVTYCNNPMLYKLTCLAIKVIKYKTKYFIPIEAFAGK